MLLWSIYSFKYHLFAEDLADEDWSTSQNDLLTRTDRRLDNGVQHGFSILRNSGGVRADFNCLLYSPTFKHFCCFWANSFPLDSVYVFLLKLVSERCMCSEHTMYSKNMRIWTLCFSSIARKAFTLEVMGRWNTVKKGPWSQLLLNLSTRLWYALR